MSDEYFDLHAQGLGYLNRVREVTPKNGPSFWACDIAALHGATDNVNTTRFDCRVSGADAITLVSSYQYAVKQDRKVLIGFRLGDLYADPFTYAKGDRAGQPGAVIKARLLYIGWIKVDGELVYTADNGNENGQAPASHDRDTDAQSDSGQSEPQSQATTPAAGSGSDETPSEVELSKDDPHFTARKDELKKAGYRFDGKAKVWRLPQATAA